MQRGTGEKEEEEARVRGKDDKDGGWKEMKGRR